MSWRTILRSRIFDAVHNVETTKPMLLQDLTIQGSNREHGLLYEPTDMGVAQEVLAALPVRDHERFTFLDYGSGKGRMLMLASRYSFKEIIGIEFTRELHEIAQRNLRQFFGWGMTKCRNVRSYLAEATTFPVPAGPLVTYLFNPFHAPVVDQVWQNLERSNNETPREVYIVAVSWARRHFEDKPVDTVYRNPSFNICRMHSTPKERFE